MFNRLIKIKIQNIFSDIEKLIHYFKKRIEIKSDYIEEQKWSF